MVDLDVAGCTENQVSVAYMRDVKDKVAIALLHTGMNMNGNN